MLVSKGKKQQTSTNRGPKKGKEPFYNPVVVQDKKKKASLGGQKKEHPAVRMVVAAPIAVDWNDMHTELTKRIADLTPKIADKAASFDVGTLKVYTDWKKKMEELLEKQTEEIRELLDANVSENSKKITAGYAKDYLDDYDKNIQEFWRDVKRAHSIRERLRTGAAKYRADSKAKIDELYAGSLKEAKEVASNESVFAQVINDSSWFKDTNNAMFVKHETSRSAGIGYSPAGSDIPLHIGHKNDKTRR